MEMEFFDTDAGRIEWDDYGNAKNKQPVKVKVSPFLPKSEYRTEKRDCETLKMRGKEMYAEKRGLGIFLTPSSRVD